MSRDQAESPRGARPDEGRDAADDDGRELDQQMARYLRLGLPLATLTCAVVAGVTQGAASVVLVLAAGALVSVIAIFWASVRTLVGETALSGADAYALGAPRAEEEQKRAVLRALKDLEFERSVGKISDEDYQGLVAKYREQGKRLIRTLDEDAEPRRLVVTSLVAARLFEEGLADAPPAAPTKDEGRQVPRKKKGKAARRVEPAADAPQVRAPKDEPKDEPDDETRPACGSCGTRNDADAVFCKKCGARQGAEAAEDGDDESAPAKAEQEKTT